ncbi:hypothetical protein [Ferrimonas sediminicola]|nr:hypothetical protein [Ferrimonas sediminicola]
MTVEQMDVVTSIGLALWQGGSATAAEQLIAEADLQMYLDKQSLKRAG